MNLEKHALELEEEEDDELRLQKQQESIYNVSGDAGNLRVTSTELYGFMWWILSAILFLAYTVWAFTPDSVLNRMGLWYLPNRYYITAIANWIGVSACCL